MTSTQSSTRDTGPCLTTPWLAWITEERTARGWSDDQLAQAAMIDSDDLRMLYRRAAMSVPSVADVRCISRALDISFLIGLFHAGLATWNEIGPALRPGHLVLRAEHLSAFPDEVLHAELDRRHPKPRTTP